MAAWGGHSRWEWGSGSWRMGDVMSPLKRQLPGGLGSGHKDTIPGFLCKARTVSHLTTLLRDAGPPLSSRLHGLGGLLQAQRAQQLHLNHLPILDVSLLLNQYQRGFLLIFVSHFLQCRLHLVSN